MLLITGKYILINWIRLSDVIAGGGKILARILYVSLSEGFRMAREIEQHFTRMELRAITLKKSEICMKELKNITAVMILLAGLPLALTTAQADELLERENAAKRASIDLIKRLGAELKTEMRNNGADGAIKVCRDLAPKINSEVSRLNGWRVTRVSDKVRNPMLGTPDVWEGKVLEDFEQRAAKGEAYADMIHGETVTENGRQYYRFMKPITVAEVCTTCHGSSEQIPASVKAQLAMEYPHDRATGYAPGDLRGAISIKQPMDAPLSTGFVRDANFQPIIASDQ